MNTSRLPSLKASIRAGRDFVGRWAGQTVVCIASGPSLTAEDCEAVRAAGLPAIVTNSSFRIAPWAAVLYGMDVAWWRVHLKEVEATFHGERVCARLLPSRFRAACMKTLGFNAYNNSGAGAISLALYGGASRIVLLGYDQQHTGGQRHWHGDHPKGLGNAAGVERWRDSYHRLRERMEKAGVEVVNCSRQTALDWPRAKLESVLR